MNVWPPKFSAVCGLILLYTTLVSGSVQAHSGLPVQPTHSLDHTNVKAKTIDFIGWSVTEPHGCDIESVDSFPPGTEKIYASFKINDAVSEGDSIQVTWYQDDESITTDSYKVTKTSTCVWFSLLTKKNAPLADGFYRIELKLGKTMIGFAGIEVGAKTSKSKAKRDDNVVDQNIVWTDKTDKTNCPLNTVADYPTGTLEIKAVVPNAAQVFEEGQTYNHIWYVDNEEAIHNKMTYKGWACFVYVLNNGDEALWDAVYRLEVFHDDKRIIQAETEVGGKGSTPIEGGITLQGRLRDADTGKAIPGGTVTILNPGVSYNDWMGRDMPEKDVYSMAESDNKGVWRLEKPLERGVSYPIVAAGKGYKTADGEIEVSKNAKDITEMDIELEAR